MISTARRALIACALIAALPGAAHARPSAPGRTTRLIATHLSAPVEFAFDGSTIFVATVGFAGTEAPPGGVYVLHDGKNVRLPGSGSTVAGVAWRNGTLYVSANHDLLAWSGWNAKKLRFAKHRRIVAMPPAFTGFSGLAIGPDGQLYTGVQVGSAKPDDYSAGTTPYANDVLRVNPATGKITVVSTGLRQPWQMVFTPGSTAPLVGELAQDNLGPTAPPDFLARATPGANFGFPSCNWTDPAACSSFTQPFVMLAAHASPMSLATAGGQLYVAFYGEIGTPEIVTIPVAGGSPTPLITGFIAPPVAVGANAGAIFTADLSGSVYRFR